MKISKSTRKWILRRLEDARILVDDASPLAGRRACKLDEAYDVILSVEEVLRRKHDGSLKRGS